MDCDNVDGSVVFEVPTYLCIRVSMDGYLKAPGKTQGMRKTSELLCFGAVVEGLF